jgi:hypothetical protein
MAEKRLIEGFPHEEGNRACPDCWRGYPTIHKDCAGLIHAGFGDEDARGDYWLYRVCDRCGTTPFTDETEEIKQVLAGYPEDGHKETEQIRQDSDPTIVSLEAKR